MSLAGVLVAWLPVLHVVLVIPYPIEVEGAVQKLRLTRCMSSGTPSEFYLDTSLETRSSRTGSNECYYYIRKESIKLWFCAASSREDETPAIIDHTHINW